MQLMADSMDPGESDNARTVQAGGYIPGAPDPAFRLSRDSRCPLPVLLSVPHAGRIYPPALLARMRQAPFSTLRLEDRLVDHVAELVACETGATLLVADAPRALIDLNRSPEDIDWDMIEGASARGRRSHPSRRSRSGLGLVPRRLAGIGEIWTDRLSQAELEERIAAVHKPYHQALGLALESLRDRWGAALLIDCHSMPPLHSRFPDEPVPEFVVGDRFGASCDPALTDRALAFLARNGRTGSRNRPYAGGYVLERHAQPARGIHCLQLEVCRTTYLDAGLTEPSARLAGLARLLAGLIRDLAGSLATGGRERGMPLAAE